MANRVSKETRHRVFVRDGGDCFRCGKPLLGHDGYTLVALNQFSIHHRKPRGMGGSRDPQINSEANLLLLCGTGTSGCHGWVESNREKAYEDGLLVHRMDYPEMMPAYSEYRGKWFNTDTGMEIKVTEGNK